MIRIFLPLICAALGLAAASCSQTEGPFAPADAPAVPQPSSHGAASAAMPSPLDSPPPASGSQSGADVGSAPAQHRASTLIGMAVVSADGSPLGEVKDIIFDTLGRATHVVIAYDTQPPAGSAESPDGKPAPSTDGKLTALPWDTAVASIKDGRVVLDDATLQRAPSFTQDEWPNLADPAWSVTADAYWRKAARPPVAAHRGNPIDSTARLRARPTRDGN